MRFFPGSKMSNLWQCKYPSITLSLEAVFASSRAPPHCRTSSHACTHFACSSSGLASSSDISPATPDSESSAGWANWDQRRLGPGEFGSKARRYWSSEESGYMEGGADTTSTPLDAISSSISVHAHLSPVHEIK